MRRLACTLAALFLATTVSAQSVPPALFVRVEPGKEKQEALRLSKLAIEARILGYLAETRMTLTFANPHARVLEGDLYFPLPEGATVSGYALDIKGVLVDGVAVEKTKGREVYEKIVRQGIDPGLVEWTKGNNFKTRVFPIPARGSRTIRVDYVADLVDAGGAATYRLPLSFKDPLDEFSLRVEVVKGAAEPKVASGGPAGLQFGKFRDSFVAESRAENAKLDKDLVITLPEVEKQKVLVEKGPDGQVYFCINDLPTDPRDEQARKAPKPPASLAILWDASASREKADHAREIALAEAYLKTLGNRRVTVDVIVFRHDITEKEHYALEGDPAPVVKYLKAVRYDGGTSLGCLTPPAEQPDLCLLFTDGISNFGLEEPDAIKCPVYILNGQATANHAFLRYLALKTGGEYFNLARLDDKTVLASIGSPAFTFLNATAEGAEETFPRLTQQVHGRFTLVGRLAAATAKVTLAYGASGKPIAQTDYTLARADAAEGTLLRRFWAQKKVADLEVFPKRNEKDITDLGKRFHIVTPYTSLIVLDSLEQYVEHRILPPKSLPEVRAKYEQIIEQQRRDDEKKERDKLQSILKLWGERVTWWESAFKYPRNFKYKAPPEAKGEARGGALNLITGAPRSEAAPPPAAPAPARAAEQRVPAGDAAQGGDERKDSKDGGKEDESRATAPAIAIKAWDPQTPYLAALKKAKPGELLEAYLQQRAEFGTSPAFFLDCGDYLLKQKQNDLALQVLSNVAELELENAALVRVLAHKLAQVDQLELATTLFEEALRLRPEEPQSHRDLALVLARRADALRAKDQAAAKALYEKALGLLAHVVMNHWERFEAIEVIALMEFNAILPRAKAVGLDKPPLDPRLVKLLDCDVRILMTWDADNTDMDLHVIEPSGEEAYYGHQRTTIGGNVSRDFTQGYGPEEYSLKKAMTGTYTIQTNYFGSGAARLIGAVTLQVDVFTHFGRPNEQRKSLTLRLTDKKETFTVGQIEF